MARRDIADALRDAREIAVEFFGAASTEHFCGRDRLGDGRSLRGNAVLRWEYRPGSTLFLVWRQGCAYWALAAANLDIAGKAVDLFRDCPTRISLTGRTPSAPAARRRPCGGAGFRVCAPSGDQRVVAGIPEFVTRSRTGRQTLCALRASEAVGPDARASPPSDAEPPIP
jgi:hypothetical protein